jgi:putative sigma-54 modulation protein
MDVMLNVEIVGRNIDVTDRIRSFVEKKVVKLDKYSEDTKDVKVVIEEQKFIYRVEIFTKIYGRNLQSTEATSDILASIDGAVDKIEKQIRRFKTRFKPKYSNEGNITDLEQQETTEIIRTSISKKPLTIEDAVLELELSSRVFFAFYNADTNNMNVLYKRSDGHYGLLTSD